MRISQLSAETGVSVPTIKFYVREQLMPPGQLTSRTQAQYDDSHVRRLRLIRALVEVADLPLERVREVLTRVDNPPKDMVAMLHQAVDLDEDRETPLANAVFEMLGWNDVPDGLGAVRDFERSLAALESVEMTIPPARFKEVAAGVQRIADAEIADMPVDSPEAAVAYSVLGTELAGPLMLALRRISHARAVAKRFWPDGPPADFVSPRHTAASAD